MDEKLYVIVEYNYKDGGYRQYAVGGWVFSTYIEAQEFMHQCEADNLSIEELSLYNR